MSSDIIPKKTLYVESPEHKSDGESNQFRFTERILSDAGLRHQLTGLTRQINIQRFADLGLGYYQFPFIERSGALRHMNLDHITRPSSREEISRRLLYGCMEVRDNLQASSAEALDISGEATNSLPYELQVVALAKAFSGDSGCAHSSSELYISTSVLTKFHDYVRRKLGVDDAEAESLREAITVINGKRIIEDHIMFAWAGNPLDAKAFPSSIVGKDAPNEGYYLPDIIEDAIRDKYYEHAWQARYADKSRQVVNDAAILGAVITNLCEFNPEGAQFWGAYGMTSLLVEQSFIVRKEGLTSSTDQLVSWRDTVADKDFYQQYIYLRESLDNLAAHADFSSEGLNLALCSAGQRIGRVVEREIVRGSDKSRIGRLRTLGALYYDMLEHDEALASRMLEALPIIASHIREAADPWRHRFS